MYQLFDKELVKAFLLLLLVIFLSNSLTVFYFSELMEDDILWYSSVMSGKFVSYRTPIGLYLEWPLWNMMVAQPKLTHLLYIMFFMAPLSFASYYLYRRYFGLLPIAAFVSAVLPNILPSMHTLPAYTNGSYIIYLTLIGLMGVLFGLKFIETKKIAFFMISIALYLLMSLATEYAAMLCLPYIIIFVICFGLSRRAVLLSMGYAVICVYTITRTFVTGFTGSSVNTYSISDMLFRFKKGFSFLLPFPYPDNWFYIVFSIFLLALISVFMINVKYYDKKTFYESQRVVIPHDDNKYILVMYLLFVIWLFSVSFFTFISYWFEARYFYLAAFPFSLLLVFTLYPVFNYIFSCSSKGVFVAFSIVVLASGLFRSVNYYENQKSSIEIGDVYFKELQIRSLPKDSQLFIIDKERYHRGIWYYCTSYIHYHSKRLDLSGHIGDALFNYDNPFVGERAWGEEASLRGIEYREPFFVYKVNRENETFDQYKYILQWDKPSKGSSWSIIELGHLDGAMTVLRAGNGWNEYIVVLKSLLNIGIRPKDIALGGYPTQNTIERLQLSDADLIPLKLLLKK